MLLPTSTILNSDPIFHVALNVLFRALIFYCLSERSRPNKLNEHSSKRSSWLCVVLGISSSSSFVRQRFCNSFITVCSIKKSVSRGWKAPQRGVKISTRRERRKKLLQGEREREAPTRESLFSYAIL